jgi:hypothetical protein
MITTYKEQLKNQLISKFVEFNNVKIPQIEQALEKSIKEHFQYEKNKTVEVGKLYSPFITNFIMNSLQQIIPGFEECKTEGYDFLINDIAVENKITFSDKSQWTGNKYSSKVSNHLLTKCCLNDEFRILSFITMHVDLDKMNSKWTSGNDSSGFTKLQILKEDLDEVSLIYGNTLVTKKATYLQFI